MNSSSSHANGNKASGSSSHHQHQLTHNPFNSGVKALNAQLEQIDEDDLEETGDNLERTINVGTAESSPNDHNNYNTTFDRERLPATEYNYVIDDLDSGDSTDENTAPKKAIPSWAVGERFNAMVNNTFCPRNPREAFDLSENTFFPVKLDLEKRQDLAVSSLDCSVNRVTNEQVVLCPLADIFRKKKTKFYQRGSTGIW